MNKDLIKKIGNRTVVVSVSGGKDSTATCLHLKEMGIPYRSVFFDTGWEHESTYEYLREYLPDKIGPIDHLVRKTEMRTPELEALAQKYETRLGWYSPMVRWVILKSMFPSRVIRWCTQELKVRPVIKYLKEIDPEPINVVGIRAEESRARAKMPEWEWSDGMDCEVWRPLIRWTFEDVIDIHQRHNVTPNPLYLGENPTERVGCYPCIFARKSEIKGLAARSPERIDLLRDLEADITVLSAKRYEARGETLKQTYTWFQSRGHRADPETGHTVKTWPIDQVVEWSRTKRGGRQFELFEALPGEQGCPRPSRCDASGGPRGPEPFCEEALCPDGL